MVSTALILLSGTYGPVVAVPSAVILVREIAVSASTKNGCKFDLTGFRFDNDLFRSFYFHTRLG